MSNVTTGYERETEKQRLKTLLWVVQILVVIFGQELPDATASLAAQVFGLCVALLGLATFALVLALLQQVQRCMAGPDFGCLRSPRALPLVLGGFLQGCWASPPLRSCWRCCSRR